MIKALLLVVLASLAAASSSNVVPFEQMGYCGGAAQILEVRVENYNPDRSSALLFHGQSIKVEIDFMPLNSENFSLSVNFDAPGTTKKNTKIGLGNLQALQAYTLSYTFTPSFPYGPIRLITQVGTEYGLTEVCREFNVEVYRSMV